ncbi:MAG TPA: hypothetical protein EYP20_06525, partial [Aigarchaeota archaeon]|nr:hypothetical protein [Aigarchaeota archaeon]
MDTVKVTAALALIVGLGLIGAIAAVLLTPAGTPQAQQPAEEPTRVITIIATEVGNRFLFALEGGEPAEPAPEIRVKVGDIVKVILKNMGKVPHSFAVVGEKRFDVEPLFNSAIGSVSRPLEAGKTGSITFKPIRAGEYYYV